MQPTWTCRHSSSAVEYTATVFRPSSLHALMTRTAISPRLAISTLVNRLVSPPPPLVAARGRTASPLLQRGAAACSACNGSPVSQPHKLLLCNGRGAGLAAGGRTATPLALRSAQACRTAHISAQITRSGAERGPSPPPHLGQERAGLHCSRQHLCMYCWQAMQSRAYTATYKRCIWPRLPGVRTVRKGVKGCLGRAYAWCPFQGRVSWLRSAWLPLGAPKTCSSRLGAVYWRGSNQRCASLLAPGVRR